MFIDFWKSKNGEKMTHIIRKIKDSKPRNITCGIMHNLTTEQDFKGMDFSHVTIKNESTEHHHKNLTEFYYVLKGSIAVKIDGKVEHLDKGSLIMIHPNTKHKVWKISDEDAEILVACCPPWSEEDEIFVE